MSQFNTIEKGREGQTTPELGDMLGNVTLECRKKLPLSPQTRRSFPKNRRFLPNKRFKAVWAAFLVSIQSFKTILERV